MQRWKNTKKKKKKNFVSTPEELGLVHYKRYLEFDPEQEDATDKLLHIKNNVIRTPKRTWRELQENMSL